MTVETVTEKRRIADDEVERIPWREFIRSQFRKIVGFFVLLAILFAIIELSRRISPNPGEVNPDNIVTLSTQNHLYLIILSSILFLAVLVVFTKLVLIDHKEEFGITEWKQGRVFLTFLLTTSFITLVYILLDIALINIYLMTLPTWLIWTFQTSIPALDAIVLDTVDRMSYSSIRGYMFVVLLLFLFIFPLTMFVGILTRLGRKTIKNQRAKKQKLPTRKLLVGLISSGVLTIGSFLLFSVIANEIISAIFLFLTLTLALVDLIFVILLVLKLIRFGILLSYSNFLLVFPFIFLFYLLPGGLWGLWDLVVIATTGEIENTIYASLNIIPSIDPSSVDITTLSSIQLARFYVQSVYLNLRPVAFIRLLQLDFIIVVGISAVVIGFAEGYSILAIFRSIAKGVSIAKTGRVASRSAPKIMVITSRLFYLGAWLSFFWDNIIIIAQSVSVTLNVDLPLIELPQFLSFVIDLSVNLGDIGFLLVFTILAVPFYFILASSFKFLSVSLVLERVREDRQYYYLLISSAFILIVTNIFADIAALPDFDTGVQKEFLPLAGAATQDLLPFVSKIFEILEAFGFYAGVVYIAIARMKDVITRNNEKTEKQDDKSRDIETKDPMVEGIGEIPSELENEEEKEDSQ